jgi:toxin ParE1/3/4
MKIFYSEQAKNQLQNIKNYIAKDNNKIATQYLLKIKEKIELIRSYPYIGKVNSTMNLEKIRDFIVYGYKVIYKINTRSIKLFTLSHILN